MTSRKTKAPEWGPADLRRAIDAAGVALWTWDVATDSLEMDAAGFALWDVPPMAEVPFELLSEKIHPADRDRVKEAFSATRSLAGPYEIDFRTLYRSEVRWISARGQGGEPGTVLDEMTGIFLDITGRKQAEEGHELLAGEMSHRVKNLLAIAAGLTKITSRSSSSIEDMSRQLTHRLMALGRAHDLVRPLPGTPVKAALLGDLFTVLLAPYDEQEAFSGRIRVSVPRIGIGEAATTSLALVVHELATNALKYGALSVDSGKLDISGSVAGDDIQIDWSEHGGPDQPQPRPARGYGSKLIHQTIEDRLGGTIDHDWTANGLIVTIRISGGLLMS